MARILIVEDTETVSRALGHVLKAGDHEVEIAADGTAALEKLRGASFDLALVDVWMPGMTGIELLTKAHADGVTIPFIMMSGGGPGAPIEFAQASSQARGAVTFLVKPFSPEKLTETVEKTLAGE